MIISEAIFFREILHVDIVKGFSDDRLLTLFSLVLEDREVPSYPVLAIR